MPRSSNHLIEGNLTASEMLQRSCPRMYLGYYWHNSVGLVLARNHCLKFSRVPGSHCIFMVHFFR